MYIVHSNFLTEKPYFPMHKYEVGKLPKHPMIFSNMQACSFFINQGPIHYRVCES